jgi:hypothetical protein
MPKYRAEIVWEFDFDEKGYTQSEYEWRWDEDEEIVPRTPEQMADYAKSELIDVLWQNVKYNDLGRMVDVVLVEE